MPADAPIDPRWSDRRRQLVPWMLAVALPVATVLLYAPVLDHPFLEWDDALYIRDNPQLSLGLSLEGLRWAFTTYFGANWFPLTWISWMLEYEAHGLSPRGVHGTNLALHALNTSLLFLALSRFTGAVWRSAFVAAVFAFHPLNVESVAWAVERKGLLASFFLMSALVVYGGTPRGAEAARRGRIALTAALLCVGLMAKALPVTLPVLLLLLDFWPLGRMGDASSGRPIQGARLWACVREKLPLFAISLAGGTMAFLAQRGWGAMAPLAALPVDQRLGNAVVSYAGYVSHFFLPVNLSAYYPHPQHTLPLSTIAVAFTGVLAATLVAVSQLRQRPYLTVGWLWFLVILVPMIGMVQLGSQGMADRYAYLPGIGLAIGATWLVADAVPRRVGRILLPLVATVVLFFSTSVTALQISYWRDEVRLFAHAVQSTERNYIAHAQLARALARSGRTQEAIAQYRAALQIHPHFRLALRDLAWIRATAADAELRRPQLALRFAQRVARVTQSDPGVLDVFAAALAANGRYADAAAVASRAIELTHPEEHSEFIAGLRARLSLYQEGRPYVQPPPGSPEARAVP
jgi:hypothetical protein